MLYKCTCYWLAKDKASLLITLRELPVLSSRGFCPVCKLRLKGKPLSLTIFLLCVMCSYQCFVHFFLSFFNKSSSAPQSAVDSIYFIPTFIPPSVLLFPFALMCVVSILSLAYLSWFHYYGTHHPCPCVLCWKALHLGRSFTAPVSVPVVNLWFRHTQTYTNIKASIPKVDAHSPSFWLSPLFNTPPPSATPIPQLFLERTSVVLPFGLWSCHLMGCRMASTLLTLCVLSAVERERPEQNARLLLAASATPGGTSSAPPHARL